MSSRFVVTALVVLVLFGAGVFGLAQFYRSQAASTEAAAGPAATAAAPALAAAVTPLGTVVAQDGFTLYRFDKDSAKPPTSNCAGPCATTWPPVLVVGPVPAVTGVDPAAVGTVARGDGGIQLTIGNWPVYRFSGDAAAGETKGEGVGNTWFAVGVDGKKARSSAEGASAGPALAVAATKVGKAVTQDGFTLYRFDKDSPKPPKTTCVDKCATTWPPVIVQGAVPAIAGVDPAAVGTVARPDGSKQLTVGNWPVYRFSGDKAAGDTAGQGVGGTWFAVAPDGKKAS
ncbi:hypothetical protein [Pseudonocardia sp. GCM10023141]|uniref:hypothetical protein n=1 Tax=Pseudonocardia sp. GCM10023141 TaxID=3252653 RepID=UPI00362369AE